MVEFAPGLPKKGLFKQFPSITSPERWVLVGQEHQARRAGLHIDLRLFKSGSGIAYSWAIRRLPEKGEKVLAKEQSLHTEEYSRIKSLVIPKGYGAGTVRQLFLYPVDIVKSDPNKIKLLVFKGRATEELSLIKTGDKDWLLVNHTTIGTKVPIKRPNYGEANPKKLDAKASEKVWQPKLDGASASIILETGKMPRVYSFRRKKGTDEPIEYTYKVPGFVTGIVPKEIGHSILRGEVFGHKKTGGPMEASRLGGILNATTIKSRELQKQHGRLKIQVFDVDTFRGKDVSDLSYKEKLQILGKIKKYLPVSIPKGARTADDKRRLLDRIARGEHPDTKEGIVEWDLNKSLPPTKGKLKKEWDVYIRDVTKAQGNLYRKPVAGAFWYSHSPEGPIVGKVNIALPAMRRDAWMNKLQYKGRVAQISGQNVYSSGAIGKPVLKGFNLDKNTPEFIERMDKISG